MNEDIAKQLFDSKKYKESLEYMIPIHNSLQDENLRDSLKYNMAKCFYQLQRADLAENLLYQLKEKPSDQGFVDLALYKNAQGKCDEAFEILKAYPNSPQAQFNLGWHLLRKGDFNAGFKLMNTGRNINVFGSLHFHKHDMKKLFNSQHCNTLAVLMEGGHGDEIIFSRWLPYLKTFCNEMKVYCSKSLVDLFRIIGFDAIDIKEFDNAEYDRFMPAMAIPALLNLNDPKEHMSFPYIKGKMGHPLITDNLIKGRNKIGIKYRGNPQFEHEQFREIDLDVFEGLTKYGEVYDLQLDNILINEGTKLNRYINSWLDTYCILDKLDIIVTSCTGIAHLSAAMGKKTIVIIPLVSYFIWAGKSWYENNVIVIQQNKYASWDGVKELVHKEIEKWLQ